MERILYKRCFVVLMVLARKGTGNIVPINISKNEDLLTVILQCADRGSFSVKMAGFGGISSVAFSL